MKWSWSGAITMVLAFAIGSSLVIATWHIAQDTEDGRIIAAISGAMVGAISTYLGIKRGGEE